MIDWSDPNCKVTENFTVNDCLMLHQWGRLGTEADGADFAKLIVLCQKLEQVRTFLGCPMNVHSIFRSTAYNLAINAPEHDVHSFCEACDFDCNETMTIEEVKQKLLPQLESLGIRLERGTTTWIHIDVHAIGNARYFYP